MFLLVRTIGMCLKIQSRKLLTNLVQPARSYSYHKGNASNHLARNPWKLPLKIQTCILDAQLQLGADHSLNRTVRKRCLGPMQIYFRDTSSCYKAIVPQQLLPPMRTCRLSFKSHFPIGATFQSVHGFFPQVHSPVLDDSISRNEKESLD